MLYNQAAALLFQIITVLFCVKIAGAIITLVTALFVSLWVLIPNFSPGTPFKEDQEQDLKAALRGTDPSIPLMFVSGNHDLGNTPTPSTVEQYCSAWGDDYFSFWVRRDILVSCSHKLALGSTGIKMYEVSLKRIICLRKSPIWIADRFFNQKYFLKITCDYQLYLFFDLL